MIKVWSDDAWDDDLYWQTQDRKTLRRVNDLIKDCERNRYEGIEAFPEKHAQYGFHPHPGQGYENIITSDMSRSTSPR